MRQRFRAALVWLFNRTAPPPPDQRQTIRRLNEALVELATRDNGAAAAHMSRVAELVEARQMAGSGPWRVDPAVLKNTDEVISREVERFRTRESSIATQGATGDLELALQNVEWRREVNNSWLEFSRWGIQQLILICRLHYIKHPWIRRGINLSAAYVFGQGVELSSPDPAANEILQRFRERNKVSLGQIALTEQEKRKAYDGNIFWCLFPDLQDKGETNVRVIDATEMQEVITDPDDADTPRYYKREWQSRAFDVLTGQWRNESTKRYYPALGYEPLERPTKIAGIEVAWDSPVYHRKVGHVASWAFGCPRVYPAIDWAKEGRRFLEACASVKQALAQIAMTITTKGGQQALEGIKQQFGTTVGPSTALWDTNPPAVAGSTFASGPGTTVAAFQSRNAGNDPSEVKEFRNMVACCLEIPPTWLGDMETSNLSTAQTLDRPTELGFLLKQEEWQEDLVVMGMYALRVSQGAPSGKLRETAATVEIREAPRVVRNGHWTYEASKDPGRGVVEVMCNFPAIREGDISELVHATVEAMPFIDEKAGARKLYDLLGFDNGDELVEESYPEASYDPDKTQEQPEPTVVAPPSKAGSITESARIRAALVRVKAAMDLTENGAKR